MNPDRFQESPTGAIVPIGCEGQQCWGFVPHPLPHLVPFGDELIVLLGEANRALGELAGVARQLPNPHLLLGPFLRREAVLSSRIEGTESSVVDLYAYQAGQLSLPGLPSGSPEADRREVMNYVHALEFGLARLQTLPVSLRLICELHERLMAGVRGKERAPGEFRRVQNWIGRPGGRIEEADFVPPPVPQMQRCLDDLEKYLHASSSGHDPLVRLALIHYQFEAVHPFLDGNGRVGRLLITLLLLAWNLLPLPLLYLSAFFEREREAYYALLLAVSQRGATADWVRFFLSGIVEQARDAAARAKQLQDLQASWRERLTGRWASSLTLRLMEHLFETPVLTISHAADFLGVTYRSAQLNVKKLVDRGILAPVGQQSYRRLFAAWEILRTAEEEPPRA